MMNTIFVYELSLYKCALRVVLTVANSHSRHNDAFNIIEPIYVWVNEFVLREYLFSPYCVCHSHYLALAPLGNNNSKRNYNYRIRGRVALFTLTSASAFSRAEDVT